MFCVHRRNRLVSNRILLHFGIGSFRWRLFPFALCAVLPAAVARAPPAAGDPIYTVAGITAVDRGPATESYLQSPFGATLDGSGNLYIADTDNHRIRKVDAVTGRISTLVGDGTRGFGGEGGPAAEAQLNTPRGVAVDIRDILYIADTENHRILSDRPPPTPPEPPLAPAVQARTFVLPQDAAPAAQEVALYAEDGAADFQAQPGQSWISVSPASGSLSEGEERVVTVTVGPSGLRVGAHGGRVYIRSGGG